MEIKVHRSTELENKIILDVELIGEDFAIGDRFVNADSNLKFELIGIGLDNQLDYINKAILVKVINENYSVEDLANRVFTKMAM